MIVYLDSSVLTLAYLPDQAGHLDAVRLMGDPQLVLLTGTWTRIEVSGALVRAARHVGGDEKGVLAMLDADLAEHGRVTVVAADQAAVEDAALHIVRAHAVRAMDAWHLATATITLPRLAEPGEPLGFATTDEQQGDVAQLLGLQPLR